MPFPGAPLALVLAAGQTVPVTPEQAQTLPTAELARAVLGPAGEAVVRVARPAWHVCRGPCSPETPAEIERRKGPAPLSQGLAFYQRPFAVIHNGSNWAGLCQSVVIHVRYDSANRVTGVATGNWFGVADRMMMATGKLVADIAAAGVAAERKCATWSTERGFHADNENSAHRAAAAATLFQQVAPRARALGIKVKCETVAGDCTSADAIVNMASLVVPERFRWVRQVRCDDGRSAMVSFEVGGCYEVTLENDGETALLEVAGAHDTLKLVRVRYTQAQVVY